MLKTNNNDITSKFEQIALADIDCQQGIYFFKKYKYQINLSKIVEVDYHNGFNGSSFKCSLMYAVCYEESLEELFWFIINCYIRDKKIKENYNLIKDDRFSTMLSHFINKNYFKEIELLFGSKEAFNNFYFGDISGKNADASDKCPIYLWITINHLYHLKNILDFFNPTPKILNYVDNSGDGILHYFSESTELFNEMGVEETIEFTQSLFDCLIYKYNLNINLRNYHSLTPTEYLIGRFFNAKDIRYSIFRFLIINYNVEYDLCKLVKNKTISEEESLICEKIVIDANKCKIILAEL